MKRFLISCVLSASMTLSLFADNENVCMFATGLNVFDDSGSIAIGECQSKIYQNGSTYLNVNPDNIYAQGNCFNQCEGTRCEGSGKFVQKMQLPAFLYSTQSTGWQTIQNPTDTIIADKNNIIVQTNGNFNVEIDNALMHDIKSLLIQNNSDFRFKYNGDTPYTIESLYLNSGNGHTITFEPGSYFIENFNHQAGTHLVVSGEGDGSGQVRLYVKNNLQINGGYTKVNYNTSLTSPYEQKANAMLLVSYEGNALVQANTDIAALLYVPNGDASINAGPMHFSGAIAANNIWFQNSVEFWSNGIDECGNNTNNPPIASDDNATTSFDIPVTIDVLANDTDSDGSLDINSITIVKQPSYGSVEILDAKVVYTPFSADYAGNDTFSYTVLDDTGNISNEANVLLLILDHIPRSR